jgi:pyrroline-5-carboxylate reductase
MASKLRRDPTARSLREKAAGRVFLNLHYNNLCRELTSKFTFGKREKMAEIAVEAPEVPAQLPKLRVAVLGAGKMGGILLQAFLKENLFAADKIHATVGHAERALALSTQWGVDVSTNNVEAARKADLILIGVKPFQVPDLIAEIKPALTPAKMLVSFAASVKTRAIEEAAGMEIAVVRAMPNTPSALGAGAAALCRGRFVKDDQMALAQRLFEMVGRTVLVDEKHMDAVTGLSGSGPAYLYIIIEALAEAGVKVGLPRDIATQLAAQTAYGAAKMVLETGYHPALLKDAVTTPAGCTIDGILELEEGGLRVTLIKAVMRATERARQLAAG